VAGESSPRRRRRAGRSAPGGGCRVTKTVVRRVALLVPLLFGVTVLTFFLVRLPGGDPASLIAGPVATREQIQQISHDQGYDRPIVGQYVTYLGQIVRGDLGASWQTNNPVTTEMSNRLPASVELWGVGMLAAAIFGVLLGFAGALRHGGLLDHAGRLVTVFGLSVPVFLIGLLAIFFLYFKWHWAPVPIGQIDGAVPLPRRISGFPLLDAALTGNGAAFRSTSAHLALPAVTLALAMGATIARQTRTAVREVMSSPYVTYARSCGLARGQVIRIIARNAAAPIVGYVTLASVLGIGGAALLETVFSWGGFSQFALGAVTEADFSVVQAYILIVAVATAFLYLLSDLTITALDPRVRGR
jgi:ABC-type dipeptide/oligopeptide/nickel transport system permease component